MNKSLSSYIDKNIEQLVYDLHKDVKSYIAYLPKDILKIVINNVYEYIPLIQLCGYGWLIEYVNKYKNTKYHNIKVISVKQTRVFLVEIKSISPKHIELYIINQNNMMVLKFGSINLVINGEKYGYSFSEDYIQIQPVFIDYVLILNYNVSDLNQHFLE